MTAEAMLFDLDAEEKDVFCQEAEELIQQLDTGLLALEQDGEDLEALQHTFRAAHTLKGSAGAIGHQRMAGLTHAMETVLDLVRQHRLTITQELTDTLLQAVDALRALNREVLSGSYSGCEPEMLIQRLEALAAATGVTPLAGSKRGGQSQAPAAPPGEGTVRITVRIAADCFAPAARALQVLMALEECGQITWSSADMDAIEDYEPTHPLELLLSTSWDPDRLRRQLQHIGDLEEVRIESHGQPLSAVSASTSGPAPDAPSAGAAPEARPQVLPSMPKTDLKTVRTSVERLDKLMNLVGELVTDRNRLLQSHALLRAQYQEAEGLGELAQAIGHLAAITDELQQEVMRARMLPLEQVFSKFPRVVRDLAREAGKQVTLQISGQETELDRSVIEEISDPLLHLLRNAVDHGIELPEERRAAGKPESGLITLAGRSEGNHIVITVADDGRGIDPQQVRQAALARGLISAEAAGRMTEEECLDLIFLPGLSTARRITDISGRGVGLDVVRNNIERLHGAVHVRTRLGMGTTFELRLPLTLAIMPVLLVALGRDTYCVPLTSVTEVLRVEPRQIHRVDHSELVLWRGRTLPLLRLRQHFRLQEPSAMADGHDSATGSFPVVAARWGEEHVGLVVDRLMGQQEIVIKNLGRLIGQPPGISGAAILGNGSVALILDVPGLVRRAAH